MNELVPTSTLREIAVVTGAAGSVAAAVLHVAILPFGADGLRYFGADQTLVELAEEGSWIPTVVAAGIAAALATAGRYALAQAGRQRMLRWQQPVYVAVTTVYLLRGIAVVPQMALHASGVDVGPPRELVFSAVALALGILHVPGLAGPAIQVERALS